MNAPRAELWAQAEKLTGICDRDALEQAAVLALIRTEASRRLASLGGSMPDAVAAPRERSE
ncbi:MAG: type II toxin-antitoxin system VapB family antitoxin [Sphingomonadales bacterium]|nr:type II toxin-antitoxin system VapB family antitoxin [Sphingomonadales bacterium]